MDDSRVKRVSDLLSSFFDRDTAEAGKLYSSFGRSWGGIAGARLGEHSRPRDVKHGILIVEADHQGWMQLLQLQQDRILAEIRRRYPELEVRGIAFRLGSGAADEPPAEPAKAPAQGTSAAPGRPREPAPAAETGGPAAPEGKVEPAAGVKPAGDAKPAGKLPPELEAMFARMKKHVDK